jgi:cysteine desulfurase / selenocysteine lyase
LDNEKWLAGIRADFPALTNRRRGRPPVYFDNACTTLVPRPVIAAMAEYYTGFPGCGGARGRHWFAREVTARIEGDPEKGVKGSRQIFKEFINAGSDNEIIFTQNTSHAINIVALGFRFHPGDVVLLTDKEHNSNLLPWLRLQKHGTVKVDYIGTDGDDSLILEEVRQKLAAGRVRLVSMAYTSNLTGYTIPAAEIIKLAHEHGARVLLDAAQTVSHQSIDVRGLDVDFLAFSVHKMCGPRGVGVLYGRQELLGQALHEEDDPADAIAPCLLGGGTVADSTYQTYTLLGPPERFEVGVQDYAGQIAAGAAIEYLQKIGLDKISRQVNLLNAFLTKELVKRYGDNGWFRLLGPADAGRRAGILTFEVKRPNAVGIAEELSERSNIMIRDGVFCVHSYLNERFGEGWLRPGLPSEHRMTYRVSLYFYNTLDECRVFLDTLDAIFRERSYL